MNSVRHRQQAQQQDADLLLRIGKQIHFSENEGKALVNQFKYLTKDNKVARQDKLDRSQFREVLQSTFKMTDDIIMDRLMRAFDTDADSCVNLSEWILGLSVFLRGTLEETIVFCFNVYDLNGDGFISKEEMFHLLKNSLVKQPTEEDPDEGIRELVDISIKKMDGDRDGRLSLQDFASAVREDSLLLEAFGQCLPAPEIKDRFLATLSTKL
ncbi:EF-hand calcium-binding domain-containing protein 1-like [Anneissia japonica]|uniref:EF-hand calcium-binding domain-containing protein 1-like n=1 Tax=Anneissia japonica TaxID=1529436 RepID=UPI0014254FD5|nr:EF-hand calcium-binding domain-containing protein 1-like [Anneissia japonica]